MNKNRRNEIDYIQADILNILGMLDEIKSQVERVLDDEQNSYDNLPECFQDGERGETMQTAIENLENAVDYVQDCIDALENADGYLEEAKE